MEVIVNDLLDKFRRYANTHTGAEINDLYTKIGELIDKSQLPTLIPTQPLQLPPVLQPTVQSLTQPAVQPLIQPSVQPSTPLQLRPMLQPSTLPFPVLSVDAIQLQNIINRELRGKTLATKPQSDETNHAKRCAKAIVKELGLGDVDDITKLIYETIGPRYCSSNCVKTVVDVVGKYLADK